MESHSSLWHIAWLMREELVKQCYYIYVFITNGFLQGSPNKLPQLLEQRKTHGAVVWHLGGSAAHSQLSLCQARDRAAPTHTWPQELIWLKINLAKSSKANQTFCGQVSILSTTVWFSVRSRAQVRQPREGTTGTGAKDLLKAGPKFSSFPSEAHQEKTTTDQLQRCSSSCSTPGAVLVLTPSPAPAPAQAAPAAKLLPWQKGPASHSWDEAEGSPEAPISCSLSRSNCCLPASQPSTPEPITQQKIIFFFFCCVIPWVLFLSAYWNGSAKNGERDHSSGGDTIQLTDRFS